MTRKEQGVTQEQGVVFLAARRPALIQGARYLVCECQRAHGAAVEGACEGDDVGGAVQGGLDVVGVQPGCGGGQWQWW